jgi:hypothetical protein
MLREDLIKSFKVREGKISILSGSKEDLSLNMMEKMVN